MREDCEGVSRDYRGIRECYACKREYCSSIRQSLKGSQKSNLNLSI